MSREEYDKTDAIVQQLGLPKYHTREDIKYSHQYHQYRMYTSSRYEVQSIHIYIINLIFISFR